MEDSVLVRSREYEGFGALLVPSFSTVQSVLATHIVTAAGFLVLPVEALLAVATKRQGTELSSMLSSSELALDWTQERDEISFFSHVWA